MAAGGDAGCERGNGGHSRPVAGEGLAPGEGLAYPVVASGLANPRGLAFAPDGALYITEAGRGGAGPCFPGPEGGQACFGTSGAVTRIWKGQQERIVTGLPSIANTDGSNAIGPQDISILGQGNAVALVGLGADPARRPALGPAGALMGHSIQVRPSGEWKSLVDISAYEAQANPDGGEIDTNPFGVLALPGVDLVADAGANALLAVAANGSIQTVAVFPNRMTDAPPFLNLPPGTKIPLESVPTSVTVGPDGAYYVGELTGFPFPRGAARVHRVVPGQAPTVYASGFTNVIDVAFGPDGSLYVLEIATNSILSGNPAGALKRVPPGGGPAVVVATTGLIAPTAMALGPDGSFYVSNNGFSPDSGQVIRVHP